MLKKILEGNIQIVEKISNWEEAIKLASKPLLEKQNIKKMYVEKMISNLKEIGPYVILMPRIAMPHARPEYGVVETCLSLLKVNKGTSFSSKQEDINLIFILGTKDNSSHMDILTELSDLFEDEEKIESIINAKSVNEIYSII